MPAPWSPGSAPPQWTLEKCRGPRGSDRPELPSGGGVTTPSHLPAPGDRRVCRGCMVTWPSQMGGAWRWPARKVAEASGCGPAGAGPGAPHLVPAPTAPLASDSALSQSPAQPLPLLQAVRPRTWDHYHRALHSGRASRDSLLAPGPATGLPDAGGPSTFALPRMRPPCSCALFHLLLCCSDVTFPASLP